MLTASECSSALEANPFFKKYDLLQQKCNSLIINEFQDSPATLWGKKFENIAFNIYSKLINKKF